jgi:hypothetical protein
VTQFIPCRDAIVTATVTVYPNHRAARESALAKRSAPRNPIEVKFETRASEELKAMRGLRRGEVIYLLAALVAAFAVGIQSKEFAEAQKGSGLAFFMLFAYGIAADQIKNALINIGGEKK